MIIQPLRVLVAVTLFGPGKNYVLPKFTEMAKSCLVFPRPCFKSLETDLRVFGDHNLDNKTFEYHHMTWPGAYAEDMLMASRERARTYAIENGYDVMCWHGVDALWQNPFDFWAMAWYCYAIDAVVAPLISARSDEHQAVCRRFKKQPYWETQNAGWIYTEEQEEIPEKELLSGQIIDTGFPGADNIFIPKSLFHVPFTEGHDPWYKRVAEGRVNVCVEEEWVRRALNKGAKVRCNTGTKVWHVHEDGIARMYKGVRKRMEDLSWPTS